MCIKKIRDFVFSKEMLLAVVSGVVATAIWTFLTKTYTSFENWVFSKPIPYVCESKKEPGIFMKEYSWKVKVPLKDKDISSFVMFFLNWTKS